MDFAQARLMMVDSQIRPSDVTDPLLLAAFREIPRERFVPSAARNVAYADLELEVGQGRYLLRPRHLAKLLQALAIRPGERALEIAGATGYGAAVMAHAGLEVTSLEAVPEVSLAGRAALDASGFGAVKSASTAIGNGWSEGGPFDVMVLNGAAERVPQAWFDQLAEGGRLALIRRNGAAGTGMVYTKAGGAIGANPVFDAAPPVLPDLKETPGFRF